MNITKQIEALLFFKSEPVSTLWLSNVLGVSVDEISTALDKLMEELTERGVVLMRSGEMVSLGTNPLVSDLIASIVKAETDKELSKAALETLSVIVYKGPISRSGIDYVRGVNSQYTLRHLLARGLVEKTSDNSDGRSLLYKPTIELLKHLGIQKVEDVPNYENVKTRIENLEKGLALLDADNNETS